MITVHLNEGTQTIVVVENGEKFAATAEFLHIYGDGAPGQLLALFALKNVMAAYYGDQSQGMKNQQTILRV